MLGCLADWMLGCVDAGFGYPDARMRGCLDARMRGCLAARIVFSPDAATFPNPAVLIEIRLLKFLNPTVPRCSEK